MADVMYFSGVVDDSGEIRLIKVEKCIEVKVPVRVSSVISKPKDVPLTDPTLAAFHEPKVEADDPQCQGDG